MSEILACYQPQLPSVEEWCDSYLDNLEAFYPAGTERIIALPVDHQEVQAIIDDIADPADPSGVVVPDRDAVAEYVEQWQETQRDELEIEQSEADVWSEGGRTACLPALSCLAPDTASGCIAR